jgi:hypothetical protein
VGNPSVMCNIPTVSGSAGCVRGFVDSCVPLQSLGTTQTSFSSVPVDIAILGKFRESE